MEYKINKESDDVIENVLLNRNLTFDMVDELLLSDEKNYESPHNYPNTDKAYRRIKKAIDNKEVIYILCDVDNDGFCSAAIIFDFLYNFMNHDDVYYILHEKNRKSNIIAAEQNLSLSTSHRIYITSLSSIAFLILLYALSIFG